MNTTPKKYDFADIINRSGLSQAEAATFIGVSRLTMNRWYHNRTGLSPIHADAVHEKMDALRTLLEDGKLPLRMPRNNRKRMDTLQELVNELKPA